MRGLDVVASDINPIALLLCSVKTRLLSVRTLRGAIDRVVEQAWESQEACTLTFPGIDKWFATDVKAKLYRLRKAIMQERGLDTRRFLWASLAETVRLTSNSRTSTFKMHIYSAQVLAERKLDTLSIFADTARRYCGRLQEFADSLDARDLLSNRRYIGSIQLLHADARSDHPRLRNMQADILMTSPPYGDNQTTVPYGQHSYLPIQWMDSKDLPIDLANSMMLMRDAYVIDHLSLGGSRVGAEDGESAIIERSPALARTVELLRPLNPVLRHKLVVYARDLDQSLEAISRRMRPNAYMFWTLGNRRIGGLVVPLADIVSELLQRRGSSYVTTLRRAIPGNAKRIALRNDRGATMRSEAVLVMRAGGLSVDE